jgi:pimeloyl-ACP methyl ester carboxylesterase
MHSRVYDSKIVQIPETAMKRATFDGTEVIWEAYGQAGDPVLVLLACPGSDRGGWEEIGRRFAAAFHVLVPELPLQEPHAQAAVLAHLFDYLGIERVYLCGHALGGVLALAFAVGLPERLHGLVLVDTTPEPFTLGAEAADDERSTALPVLPSYRSPGFLSALERITTPTLIVAGESDTPFLQRGAELLHGWIPFSRLARVPDAGHTPQMENPRAFGDELAAFLREMEQARLAG